MPHVAPKHDIRLREVLSDGRTLIIQGFKRRTFSCYLIAAGDVVEAPEYLVEGGTLDDCREAAADVLQDDVCDVM